MRSIGSAASFAAISPSVPRTIRSLGAARIPHDRDRTILAVRRLELFHDITERMDRKMDRQRCARRGEGCEPLAFGHGRGAARHAGEHDALRDLGNGQFAADRGGGGGESGNARRQRVGNAAAFQPAELLGERAENRQVARLQARHVEALVVRRHELGLDLVERERRRVDDARTLGAKGEKLRAARSSRR